VRRPLIHPSSAVEPLQVKRGSEIGLQLES